MSLLQEGKRGLLRYVLLVTALTWISASLGTLECLQAQ